MQLKKSSTNVTRKLSYMRCLEECLNSLSTSNELPIELCYEPLETKYKITKIDESDSNPLRHTLAKKPLENYDLINDDNLNYKLKSNDILISNGIYEINSIGHWIQIIELHREENGSREFIIFNKPFRWILKYSHDSKYFNNRYITPLQKEGEQEEEENIKWLSFIEESYNLNKNKEMIDKYFQPNYELMNENRKIIDNWSVRNDIELVNLLKNHINIDNTGSIKHLVKNILVSSQRVIS